MTQDIARRTTFNQAAWLYDKARPQYPDALFKALIERAHLKSGVRLLEIGLGTGQATRPLAQRGYTIIAIELGKELAEVARQNLSGYSNVKVVTGAFEDLEFPTASFDLVYSATAFHWIKPEVKYTKSHDLLKPNGHLAIIHTNHVSDEAGDSLYTLTQPVYNNHFPRVEGDEAVLPPHANEITPPAFDANLFQLVDFELFPLVVNYTAEEYTDLLATFSPTLALPHAKRVAFLSEIRDIVNQNLGGIVRKSYAMSLALAKKR